MYPSKLYILSLKPAQTLSRAPYHERTLVPIPTQWPGATHRFAHGQPAHLTRRLGTQALSPTEATRDSLGLTTHDSIHLCQSGRAEDMRHITRSGT